MQINTWDSVCAHVCMSSVVRHSAAYGNQNVLLMMAASTKVNREDFILQFGGALEAEAVPWLYLSTTDLIKDIVSFTNHLIGWVHFEAADHIGTKKWATNFSANIRKPS